METTETDLNHEQMNESCTEEDSSVFTKQFSESEGGIPTDLFCPDCGDTICGTYLPIFRCPHCEILIWRDEDGTVTYYEQKHTCPECGHSFNGMAEEEPNEFRRACSNLEQKVEEVFKEIDHIVDRFLA